jgi:uncharacterized membrane protein YhaH (DUF805 family)
MRRGYTLAVFKAWRSGRCVSYRPAVLLDRVEPSARKLTELGRLPGPGSFWLKPAVSPCGGMGSITASFSFSGRIAPRPFALGVAAVYVASFFSQFLLAAPVTERASLVPFLLMQAVTGWAWTALHVKRLRDAGRSPSTAVALAAIYALAIVLLLLVIAMTHAPAAAAAAGETPSSGWGQTLLLFFLISVILSDPNFGLFGVVILSVLALVMLPIVIAIAFTIWTGTRPPIHAPP